MLSMEKKQSNFSILMFPWLAHGHVFPYLELAKNLSNKNFHIYLCAAAINLTSINDEVKNSVSIELVELHLPELPELPPHYHTTKNVPPDLMPKLLQAFQNSRSSFSAIITSLKPDLLIYDVFQPWAATVASSLGVPAVHFSTSGAAPYSVFYHGLKKGSSAFPSEAIYQREHEKMALKGINLGDEMVQDTGLGHFNVSCEIVLMKTCRELEGKYIDYLSDLCKREMVPVGPIVTQPKAEEEHSEIMEWLDKQSPFSTVFISFGSENYLSRDQMGELAKGLESCKVNFIWVVRFPPANEFSLDEALPEGFIDKVVKQRGMIVQGWAPQANILAHPSTGGFLSHCGWSSTIESIYFGVPVIGIPLKLDQPLNARVAVEAGVGIEVERDANGDFTGEDIASAVNKTIKEKTGEDMRARAAELSKKIRIEEDDAINEAAGQLRRICMEHKQHK